MTLANGKSPRTGHHDPMRDIPHGGYPVGSPEAKAIVAMVRERLAERPRKHVRTRPDDDREGTDE